MPNNETPNTRAAQNIRALMGIKKKNINDLARCLQINRLTASKRYHGLTPYDLNQIETIASWLNEPVDRIILTATPAAA